MLHNHFFEEFQELLALLGVHLNHTQTERETFFLIKFNDKRKKWKFQLMISLGEKNRPLSHCGHVQLYLEMNRIGKR